MTWTTLSLLDGELLFDSTDFRIVGGLQYLTLTRPGIVFVVNMVSQFMPVPRSAHMHVVKRIFRYLAGAIDD